MKILKQKIYGLEVEDRLINVFSEFLTHNSQKSIVQFLIASLIKQNLRMLKDGDSWCIMIGSNLQAGIAGFGHTKYDAWIDFIGKYLSIDTRLVEEK